MRNENRHRNIEDRASSAHRQALEHAVVFNAKSWEEFTGTLCPEEIDGVVDLVRRVRAGENVEWSTIRTPGGPLEWLTWEELNLVSTFLASAELRASGIARGYAPKTSSPLRQVTLASNLRD